jgi:hypothetical protein
MPMANTSVIVMSVVLTIVAGCSSRPSGIALIDVDPGKAANAAIEVYDANDDGKLSDDELQSIPGMLKWKQLYDIDSDGFVSESEIERRIQKWLTDKMGFTSLSARVTLDGRQLPHVHILLMPEAYLDDAVKPASGTTNDHGYASLSVAPADMPEAIKMRGAAVSGVYPGIYRISLSHPVITLPDRDASGKPLGTEVSRDTTSTAIDIALASP